MNKLERLQNLIPSGADAILVTSETNQYYLTGFNFTDGYVLVTAKQGVLCTDFRYIEAAKANANKEFEVREFSGKRSAWMNGIFAELGIKTLAYEDETLTCAALEALKNAHTKIEFVPLGNVIERMREYKDEAEIANIIAAQRIAEKAFDHIIEYISPERTEIDVALELEFYMRSHGAENVSFKTIAVSGSASSLPHGEPRPCKLEKGFLTMDYGAIYNGYCSDMTRTVCLGKADDEMKRVYNTVLEAQTAAHKAMALGKKTGDIDKVARDMINAAGYEGCFGHSLGHGVGLFIHEAPYLSTGRETLTSPGHVVTNEPGIYIEGKYGVRIEDMVVFRADGPECITKSPRELFEI